MFAIAQDVKDNLGMFAAFMVPAVAVLYGLVRLQESADRAAQQREAAARRSARRSTTLQIKAR